MRDQQLRGDGEAGDRHHHGEDGRGRQAAGQRARPHARSMNPTPRTVWMSGGSPSLRRRRVT
jgi:hypothetical protein